MIIRKPYAFLIKHFRKIHILLLALCAYIYYKNLQLSAFVNEFMSLGTYDVINEPIAKHVSFFVIIAMLIVIIGSIILVLLLRHKKKPWKLYLIPALEYTFMLIIFLATKSFFDSYTGGLDQANIRAIRDFLFIATLVQYPIFIIFIIRIFGVDLNKFNFKMDEEYLELNNEDREELEINIDFDKESLKRGAKRLIRNIGYVYQEHKLIANTIISILLIILLYNSYKFIFITNKSYKEGESLNANGYTITLNNSYYTDKDYKGDIVSEKSAFVILDLTIKNNSETREIDLNKFHVMNGINDYVTTAKTFETEFQDFGKAYEKKELKRDESFNLIMIFKVNKDLSTKRFVLYYQEFNNNEPHLRKIKLKLNNMSEINKNKTLTLGEEMNFTLKKQQETVIFDEYEILDTTDYSYRVCYSSNCSTYTGTYTAPEGYKILKISFASNNFEGKDMIDFSTNYGKINYINGKNKKSTIAIKNPFNKTYYGKYLYTTIPIEAANSSSIELTYTVRNNQYTYKIR